MEHSEHNEKQNMHGAVFIIVDSQDRIRTHWIIYVRDDASQRIISDSWSSYSYRTITNFNNQIKSMRSVPCSNAREVTLEFLDAENNVVECVTFNLI